MNIKYELGQLLIVGFKGAKVSSTSPIIDDIQQRNLGGVILFDRFLHERLPDNNILSSDQVRNLVADLKESATRPLLVAVDQEGGQVNRFKAHRGFPETPSAELLGQEANTRATEKAADQTARMLANMGINLNLAPVTDLNSYPENPIIGHYQRSFSSSPEQVIHHNAAWIKAHHQHGILCCLKHFPGHGSARDDSHLGFVDISNTWLDNELLPYRTLINKKIVNAVMTGHLFNRHLDENFPATLSRPIISDLLRDKLAYDGVVISDDMQMRAITHHYGLEEAVTRAVNAGVDLLIFGNNLDYDPGICMKVINIIERGLCKGLISETRIEQSLGRVEKLKSELLHLESQRRNMG